MAEGEVKISALPSGSSLTGVEKIPMVQGGITIEASAQEIADLSSFDPENITTNLVFNPTASDRSIYKVRTQAGITHLQQLVLAEGSTQISNIQINSGDLRSAIVYLSALGHATISYSSPEGNNQLTVKPNWVELMKVGRYTTAPTISNDLDIPHKKYVDDLSNSKQDRLAGIVSGCEITVETFSGTPVATNKQIKVSKGLALTNSWYIPTSEYSKLADTISSEITLCPTGGDFKYYDIVADNTNAITIHEGTPSTSPVHYVIDPLTEVLLGFITVGDAVIEEPVVTPSSRIYSNFFPQLITTTNQSLSVRTIQGLDRLNALFLNQTDPLDNGLYGWNGVVWVKFSFPMGFWDTETDFLYNTLFIAQEGDYANQAFVFNNYIGNRSSRNISGGGLTQASQTQVEAAFDNTDQTTPVVLEQTSALTPFNAWWLVQKIKTWVKAGFTLTGALNYASSITPAASATPAIGAAASNNITITSTTTITGFDTIAEGTIRRVKFSAVTPLTHSANLDLPTSANITTAVGDEAVFRSNGAGSWKCIAFMRKDGSALVGGGSFQTLPTEVTGSLTAANDKYYVNTASATYTDPTGVQGKGFVVLVRGGTATVGGTAYTTGVIYRYFNSAAWSNIMLRDFATITGDITFTAGVGTIANNAVTNAKAAQMAANTIKANNTGSTANAADITTDQFTAMMEIAVAVGTTGIITAMTSATYKYIRLTSASATGLGSIIAPSSSYKDLYIWNDTGVTLTLYHDYSSEATAANRILCGANRSWANNTMLHLKYDVTEARWCTVAQDGNTFRSLLQGTGDRLVQASSTGQESATITTLDIDFSGAQQTSATSASWTGVNEVNISGLLQGQLYIDVSGGYRYECHRNDYCSRTPVINVETFTTNSIYPITEVTGTSGTLVEDEAYVLNNASQVVMSLPTAGTFGKVIIVNAKGAGGGRINTGATQQIVGTLGVQPTVGQDISFPQHSAITLKCTTGHATAAVWSIFSVNPATTITII